MSDANLEKLRWMRDQVRKDIDEKRLFTREIIQLLHINYNCRCSFTNGTFTIRMSGVRASCTDGTNGLLEAWIRAADRKIEAGSQS